MTFSLLTISAILLLVLLVLVVRIQRRTQKLYQRQEALWTSTPFEPGELRFRVFASSDAAPRGWRMMPDIGFVALMGPRMVVRTVDSEGREQVRELERAGLKAEWIGFRSGRDNLHWFALGEGESRLLLTSAPGMNAVASRQDTVDLFRNVVGQDVPLSAMRDFVLEKRPAIVAAFIVIAAVLFYAPLDGFVLNPLEVAGAGSMWLAVMPMLVALAGMYGGYALLIRAKVRVRESRILGMLLALSFACATVPLSKRLDTLTASEPMRDHEYVMVREGQFEPVDKAPPYLNLPAGNSYWAQFEPKSRHRFKLQHGGLGLWQLDRRELDEAIRAYQHKAVRQGHVQEEDA